MKTLALTILIASTAFSQANPGSVGGPVLGLVFDRDAAAVRPLLGIPGSSTIGQPLDAASGLLDAVAAPDYALGIDASGSAMLFSATGRRPLPGDGQGASTIVVSPRGSAAALYFAGSLTAQIFTGLPDSPVLARTVTLERPPGAMAIADDGATLLAASRTARDVESVFTYAGGQPSQVVDRSRRISALAFVPGTANALIAERNGVKLFSAAFGIQTVDDAAADVVAVAASTDGSRVFAATRAGEVVIRDLRSSMRTSVTCGCTPVALAPLRGNAVFRLNGMGDGPLWVIDGDSAEPRVLFVAAPAGGSQ